MDPSTPPSADRPRRPWLALFEAAGVSVATLALATLAMLPWFLPRFAWEVELVPDDPGVPRAVDVIAELQALPDVASVRRFEDAERTVWAVRGDRFGFQSSDGFRSTTEALGLRIDAARSVPPDPMELLGEGFRPMMTVQAVVFCLIGALMIRLRVAPPAEPRAGPLATVGWGIVGGVVAILANLGVGAVVTGLGIELREQPMLQRILDDPGLLLAVSPWIVAFVPIAEEVLFRGYLLRFLDQRVGRAVGVVASSVVFAAVHWNPSGFASYVAVGLVFAWVYLKTGRLAAPVLAHAFQNGVIVVGALAAARMTGGG